MTQDSSYQLRLEGDTLWVGFNAQHPAQGHKIVQDAMQELDHLIESGQLLGSRGVLKIDGPQSISVAYALAHRLAHRYEAIAVLDPKLGRPGFKAYIVSIVNGSTQYVVGQVLEFPHQLAYANPLKVVLCGPPRVGKSCFREALRQAIHQQGDAPYPYSFAACPDGEGSWFHETYGQNAAYAKEIRQEYRGQFSPAFVQAVVDWVKNVNLPLNIIDVGGRISAENTQIMAEATHAIILYQTAQELAQWKQFCLSLELDMIAEIQSQFDATEDQVLLAESWQVTAQQKAKDRPLVTGSIHRLQRGRINYLDYPMCQAIAEVLVHLVGYQGS